MNRNGSPQPGVAIDLKGLRSAAGLSQQRVAELAGCSLAAVALYERGYRPDSSSVLPLIVEVLKAELRDREAA
jgi:transcriptional regulator with XRE-family HTH domain